MTFGEQYPEKPPRVRFTSEVFHPNVYSDGTLCMDIIQDQWSPIHNVCTLLTSIQSLLTDPNPASPANPEAAQLFQEDPSGRVRKGGYAKTETDAKRVESARDSEPVGACTQRENRPPPSHNHESSARRVLFRNVRMRVY